MPLPHQKNKMTDSSVTSNQLFLQLTCHVFLKIYRIPKNRKCKSEEITSPAPLSRKWHYPEVAEKRIPTEQRQKM